MVIKNSNYKATMSDWIDIGIKTLARSGHLSINISGLGKEIGATKGSFYWYFSSKKDYELALYSEFENLFVPYFSSLPDEPNMNVSDFFDDIYSRIPHHLIRLELAIRDWARNDEDIFIHCKKLDKKRLSWIEAVLKTCGVSNEREKAVKVFAITIGMSLLPEFIGSKYRALYKSALIDII